MPSIGMVGIKVNHIEAPDGIASRIAAIERKVGPGRVKSIHPYCGFWTLKCSRADRKM